MRLTITQWIVVWGHKVTNLKATHNSPSNHIWCIPVVWGHKVTNLKATHNHACSLKLTLKLFEVTKLWIWKQLTTNTGGVDIRVCCLRSQSYKFESNSQRRCQWHTEQPSCLRSQSYEFESNSQRTWVLAYRGSRRLRSQSYEFESNSQP